MNRTKLPIQARLIRAGIYALLVAMSYWVSSPYTVSGQGLGTDANMAAHVGGYDVQFLPMWIDSHRSVHGTYDIRVRDGCRVI